MGLINEGIKSKLKNIFSQLKDDVTLKVFTQELECPTCRDNTNFMQEISELSYKIKIDVLNFVLNKDEAEKLKIDKIPATAILGDKDYGIRFFGIPAGYEFNSFINAIKMVSLKDSSLKEDIKQKIKLVNKPVNIKVFVTLTCPYCPAAVEVKCYSVCCAVIWKNKEKLLVMLKFIILKRYTKDLDILINPTKDNALRV